MENSGQDNSSRESVKDWTKTQADQITGLYKSLHGRYQEEANNRLFGGPQLPYEQAQSILTDLLRRQEGHGHKESGLENVVKKSIPLLDLGAVALTAGLLATAPPLGIATGIIYIMSKYYSSYTKSIHP